MTATPTAEVLAEDAPVVQVVQRILTQAMRDRASDVHIEPTDKGVRVRYRIDGALKEVLTLPASMSVGLDQPHQDHGRHEHRGTATASGWPVADRDRWREVDVRVATLATIWGRSA